MALPKPSRAIVLVGTIVLVMSGGRALAQDAEQVYAQKCANCHAKDGSGHTPAASKLDVPDFRSKRVRDMSDEELYNSIAQGTRHKDYPHAFLHTGLAEQQVRALVRYVRALGAVKPRQSPRPNAR